MIGVRPVFHPGWAQPARVTIEGLPDDSDGATEVTISRMREYALEDARSDEVRSATLEATGGASDARDIAGLIHSWVRAHVQFVQDADIAGYVFANPDEVELLIRPRDLLRMAAPVEDCDGFSMLTASMLTAAGVPASFVTVAADGSDPSRYSHVYVYASMPDGSVFPVDSSHGPVPGWEIQNRYGKRKVWRIGANKMLAGLGTENDYLGLDLMPGGGNYPGDSIGLPSAGGSSTATIPFPQVTAGGGSPSVSSPGFNWGGLLTNAENIAGRIFTARYAVPPPGTYITQSPQGSTIYTQPQGSAALALPMGMGSMSTSTLLIIAALGVGALVLFGHK